MPVAPFRLMGLEVEPLLEPARVPPIPAASKAEAVMVVLGRPILPDMAALTIRSNHLSLPAAVAAMAVAAALLRMAGRAAGRSGLMSPAHWPSTAEFRQTAKMETSTAAAARAAAFGLPPAPLPDQEPFPRPAAPATGSAVVVAAGAFPWDTRPVPLTDRSRLVAAADMRAVAPERFTPRPTTSPWVNCSWTMAACRALTRRCPAFMAFLLHLLTLRSAMARWSARNRHSRC